MKRLIEYLREKRNIKLKMSLLEKAGGYTLDELPMVYSFVVGDLKSLRDLSEFRKWKEQKRNEEVINPSRQVEL